MRIKQLSVDEIKVNDPKQKVAPVRPSGAGSRWLMKPKAQSEDRLDGALPVVSPGPSRKTPINEKHPGPKDSILHRAKSSHNEVIARHPANGNQLVRAWKNWFNPSHDQQRRATISPLSEKLVFIQNNRGDLQYFIRRRYVIDGKEVEQWREMDAESGTVKMTNGDAPLQKSITTPAFNIGGDCHDMMVHPAMETQLVRRNQKQLPVLPSTNGASDVGTKINLFGMQNVAINVTVHDLFGLGYFSMAFQKLYQFHREFLERQTAAVRYLILAWEIMIITLILWQVIRVLSLIEMVVGLLSRAVSDGLDIVEMGIGGIFVLFRRAGELLGIIPVVNRPTAPIAPPRNDDGSYLWKFSRHIW